MNVVLKRFLILMLALITACSAALADGAADVSVCLNCGQEFAGSYCSACSAPAGTWTCIACGTRNISGVCRNCGKEKTASLALQAEDSRLVFAFPAIRGLAAAGDPAALVRLAECYEQGIGVTSDISKAESCLRQAGEAGFAPAWRFSMIVRSPSETCNSVS